MGKGRVVVQGEGEVVVWDLRKDGGVENVKIALKQPLRVAKDKLIGVTTSNKTVSLSLG